MFDSLKQQFQDFSDEQRVERLRGCASVQEPALNACKKQRDEIISMMQEQDKPEKDVSQKSWLRWAGSTRKDEASNADASSGDTDESSSIQMHNIPNCNEQAHALWRCRGLALGCGEDVMRLEQCFKAGGLEGDCMKEQLKLGECASKNAQELEQRRKRLAARG